MNEIIKPRRLMPGSTIGFLSPSYAYGPDDVRPAAETLEKLGYKIKFAKNIFSNTLGFAGTVYERSEDFNELIADSKVDMLLFGGGEVCNEILPYVDFDMVRRNPKIICSYSDSTTILNAVYTLTGIATFYGETFRTFINPSEYNLRSFQNRLCDGLNIYEKSGFWRMITPGYAKGELLGGYLVNFATLLGGRYFTPDKAQKYILFIEDHEKFNAPAAVSKWFSHIEQSGLFDNITGLIFGHYSQNPNPQIDGILRRIGERYEIPVVMCDDFGHGENNSVIPIGIKAELNADSGIFNLLEPAVV
jgi:Uncharacterized proteins, homologs of microcin C7 resistance protein MccF